MPLLSKLPKWALPAGIVAGGGALVYSYVKKKNQAKAAALSQDQSGTSTDMTGASPDAASGYDQGAYMYEPYGSGYGPYGLDSYGGGGTGAYGDTGYYGAGVPYQVQAQATTNAQWVQAALSVLTQNGYDAATTLAALGAYTLGQGLTASQEQVVSAAVAAEGYPPVEGPGGFPPQMKAATPNTGGGGTGQVTVPKVTGLQFGSAYNTLTRAGLISEPGSHGQNAKKVVKGQLPAAGTKVDKGTVVHLTF